jgi:hypothetical protein
MTPEQPTNQPSENLKSLRSDYTPSPQKTIADLAVSLLSHENARFQRKMNKADSDVEKHRARMHKAADAQTDDFVNRTAGNAQDSILKRPLGAEADACVESTSNAMEFEDDMAVFTNSPVNVTNHPSPVIVQDGLPAWAKVLVWLAGILSLLLVILFLIVYGGGDNGGGSVPDVVPPAQNGDIHLEVIPGKDRMMQSN